ncbi:DUF2752 domain-containing protein [Sandaracinomonas limnophila]|uniref:DUF2752 domain-containing protein n=1 Tax=Sandaracinomonas limnophila TaxID=1862386 RepID=A0A437PP90_9BACT|nr:DUF2752 domain-containing protein [Sandaracinomonas limnophila]
MEMVIRFLENNQKWLLFILPILIWFIDFNAGEQDFSFCLFKNIFGFNCYGCGFLRGFSAFLHLKFDKMFELNPLNLLTVPHFVFILGHLLIKK